MASRSWAVAVALLLVALLGCSADESSSATGGGGTGNAGATTSSGGSGANGGTGTGGTGGQATGGSGGATPTSVRIAVIGDFDAKSVVMLNDSAKAITAFSSDQLRALAGKHSCEIAKLLGPGHKDVIATPEDIVFLDY